MGGDASPIFGQIVVDDLIEESLLVADFRVSGLKKFVDDLFCIVQEDKINDLVTVFNNYSEHIKFSYEVEQDFSLPYLDVLLKYDSSRGVIKTDISKEKFRRVDM